MDFFAELEALQRKSPRLSMLQINSINSDYNFAVAQLKKCYRLANAVQCEDCMYGRDVYESADCIDCDHILKCTLCYGCLNCKNCYNGNFLQDCEDCQDCSFGYDLRDCKNCFGCSSLRKKEYYIFNKPYSKEEYFAEVKGFMSDVPEVRAEIALKFETVKESTPRIYSYQTNSENCVGNYVHNSQNAFCCFDAVECQDIEYVMESKKLKDCADISILEESEMSYEISSSRMLNNCNFCYMCVSSSDIEYCEFVNNSKFCFGCITLNHKEYHILNQPYPKDEYFKKVAEIKDQLKAEDLYGRKFLPSTYPLQDTVAVWEKM